MYLKLSCFFSRECFHDQRMLVSHLKICETLDKLIHIGGRRVKSDDSFQHRRLSYALPELFSHDFVSLGEAVADQQHIYLGLHQKVTCGCQRYPTFVLLADRIREADDPSFYLSVFLGCYLEFLYRIFESFA